MKACTSSLVVGGRPGLDEVAAHDIPYRIEERISVCISTWRAFRLLGSKELAIAIALASVD